MDNYIEGKGNIEGEHVRNMKYLTKSSNVAKHARTPKESP